MSHKVTVTERIFVPCAPEEVWDFTQDYARRHEWDPSVLEATVLEGPPVPRVQVRCAGGLKAVFQYRQFERPSRTSLAMEDVQSFVIAGGGGSWSYVPVDGGTSWTQTNTLILKPRWWAGLLAPLVRMQLGTSTRRAMKRAKRAMHAMRTVRAQQAGV